MTIAVMAEVQCVDGSVLSVLPVPRRDRRGTAYEVTLRVLVDGAPFGEVGECSGWRLARAAHWLRQAQAVAGPDAFPPTGLEALLDGGSPGVGGPDGGSSHVAAAAESAAAGRPWAELRRLLPRDSELLCLRSRDPDDGGGSGELRVWLRHDHTWLPADDGAGGRWSTRSRAVLDCWGDSGRGVRAVLDASALLRLLDVLVAEGAAVAGSRAPV